MHAHAQPSADTFFLQIFEASHQTPKRPESDHVPILTSLAVSTVLLPPCFAYGMSPRGTVSQRPLSSQTRSLRGRTHQTTSHLLVS